MVFIMEVSRNETNDVTDLIHARIFSYVLTT